MINNFEAFLKESESIEKEYTFEDILSLPVFKDLQKDLNIGIYSTSTQRKNKTLVIYLKSEDFEKPEKNKDDPHVYDRNHELRFIAPGYITNHGNSCYVLYNNGNINVGTVRYKHIASEYYSNSYEKEKQEIVSTGPSGYKTSGKSLEEWEKAIKIIRKLFIKYIEEIEKEGIKFKYNEKIVSDNLTSKKITFEEISNLPEFKKLISSTVIECISNKAQQRNSTIIFAIPKKYVFNKKNVDEWNSLTLDNYDYCLHMYSLTSSGKLVKKRVNFYNYKISFSDTTISSFDSSDIKEYSIEIIKIMNLFKKFKESQEKEGAMICITKEEAHEKRGRIHGRKFNI